MAKKGAKKNKSGYKSWLLALLLAYFLIIAFRLVIGFPLSVSNASMLYALKPGSIIWVNKLSYGLRLPATLFSIQPFNNWFLAEPRLPYKRLSGIEKVNRYDKVLFNFPYQNELPFDKRPLLIKRVIGLPNEEIAISESVLFINQEQTAWPETAAKSFIVKFKEKPNQDFFDTYNIIEGSVYEGKNTYELTLTQNQFDALKKNKLWVSGEPNIVLPTPGSTDTYPGLAIYPWTKDYFGPLWIPAKGEEIKLSSENFLLYRHIISEESGKKLSKNNNSYFLNDKEITTYTFKENYYFLVGDNLDQSSDSRNWGLVSEKFIIGKISVLFS
jgi:signal peptidase I